AATGLPMANVERLMRRVIPKGFRISSSSKQLTHDCTVEFAGFITGEASEQARAQHRRAITPEDYIASFEALGFDDYVEPMNTYVRGYCGQHNTAGYGGGYAWPPHGTVPATVTAPDASRND
ncbi:nuclear transcription factor Y subunit B-1-like, partial [Panicum hallii]